MIRNTTANNNSSECVHYLGAMCKWLSITKLKEHTGEERNR